MGEHKRRELVQDRRWANMMALFANAHRGKGQRFKAEDFLPAEPRAKEGLSGEAIMEKFDAWAEKRN